MSAEPPSRGGATRSSKDGPARLRDVAQQLGIHPATVSRALNERTRHLVNPATALRITAAADELGYTPNSIARSLKTARSLTIGVVLPDLTNPLFPPIVRGIEDALSLAGFTALIANTDNDAARARAVVQTLRLRQVDGWISAIATLHDGPIAGPGAPVVLLNRQDEAGTPAVVGDDADGVAQSIAHLVSLGHTRIAHVAGPQTVSTGANRHAAYRRSLAAHGLQLDPALVRVARFFGERAGSAALAELLDGGADFTAVVAANDLLALGCYEQLARRGLRAGEDVSVVGFNDMHFADRFDPPLTTVRVPHHEMGRRAAELLLGRIEGSGQEPSLVVLPAQLIARRSTAAPRARASRSHPRDAV